jgi:hypothetical protein
MVFRQEHVMQSERRYDKTVEDTFPASDAPASSGIAGPDGDKKPSDKQPTDDVAAEPRCNRPKQQK